MDFGGTAMDWFLQARRLLTSPLTGGEATLPFALQPGVATPTPSRVTEMSSSPSGSEADTGAGENGPAAVETESGPGKSDTGAAD